MLDSSSVEQESSLSEKSVVIVENLNKATQDNQTKTLVSTSGNNVFQLGMMDAPQSVEFKQSYMENEEFLSRNCYGGGKRKGNDSDVDYDPGHAKKLQKKKRKRKYNRKTNPIYNPNRPKGESRSSQRIKAV